MRKLEPHDMMSEIPPPPGDLAALVGDINHVYSIAYTFLGYLTHFVGLDPSDSILDVGCGFGRLALPLTNYLNESGRYEGFDPIERMIAWGSKEISSRFPNFQFKHIDLYNGAYNPGGKIHPESFTFPYGEAEFDVVLLTSIFTHMMPPEIPPYLREIQRVLKTGGRCLFTCLMITDQVQDAMAAGASSLKLKHHIGDYPESWSLDLNGIPETGIGYRKEVFQKWIEDAGLKLHSIHQGHWPGVRGIPYHDIVIIENA